MYPISSVFGSHEPVAWQNVFLECTLFYGVPNEVDLFCHDCGFFLYHFTILLTLFCFVYTSQSARARVLGYDLVSTQDRQGLSSCAEIWTHHLLSLFVVLMKFEGGFVEKATFTNVASV